MEQLPIAFHTFATLWIQKVGHQFDAVLRDVCYGNRLRRTKSTGSRPGKPNSLSLGTMVPYLGPYCRWRDDGLAAIRAAVASGKNVAALTADATSFFHRLDPTFMRRKEFRDAINVGLSPAEEDLHELFIQALSAWGRATPIGRGLPVGLTASGLIANVALFELDDFIRDEVSPLHYGRYVDDIILVLENGARFTTVDSIWDWLASRPNSPVKQTSNHDGYRFERDYLSGSDVCFKSSKNRAYVFWGASGEAALDALTPVVGCV